MRFVLPLGLVFLSTPAAGQSIVLPAAASSWPGRWAAPYVFYHPWHAGGPNEARTQLLYDLAEVSAPLPVVRALDFRTWEEPIANPPGAIDLEVRMSTSPRPSDDPDVVFANNGGPNPSLVFSGTVSLPATSGGSWPQPWAVSVPLTTPFPWAPAPGDRSLVVDVACWNNTATGPWLVEIYDVDVGSAATAYQTASCVGPTGMPQFQWSVSNSQLIPGGRIGVLLGMYPTQHPSLANNALCLGTQSVGGSWLGHRLPVPLQRLGIPAPTGCDWAVDVLATSPMDYDAGAGILDNGAGIPIPNDPLVVGMRLYVQNAALARYAAGLQVFPSTALALTIRSGAHPRGSHVVATGDRRATSGSPRSTWPIAIRLR
jgi:hypothetical protein